MLAGFFPFILPAMNTRDQFLKEIEQFLRRTGMTDTSFGLATMNDGKFVVRLRAGHDARLGTYDRVRAYMKNYAGNGRRRSTATANAAA